MRLGGDGGSDGSGDYGDGVLCLGIKSDNILKLHSKVAKFTDTMKIADKR